ncbi:MAG TPA: MBL fold metallo-hydrolase [Candidatus Korarchaeota archaeon]|nr:MBL fold metallo-hydrolase [Candidatus Korarchaeota archaeon]
MSKMLVSVLSGYNEVGRSAILVEAGDTRILLDYGMKLIPKSQPLFPPEVEGVDAVLLSHAHLDHSGAIPALFRSRGKWPKVYALDITRDYSDVLLADAIKVAKARGHTLPYGMREVRQSLANFRQVEFGVPFKVGDVEITAYNAGHIPGSAMFYLRYDGKSILYTGDLNMRETRLMPAADTSIPKVDLLIMESTYAFKEHPRREGQEMLLKEVVDETLKSGGVAVIAGFAIGRLLEIAMALKARGFRGRMFLDGMARRGAEITDAYPDRVRDPDILRYVERFIKPVDGWRLRKKLVKRPNVILTTSGMLEGGPVHFYLKELKDDPKSSVTLTGYQIEGTEGRRLIEEGRMTIDGEEVEIQMKVNQLNFSAHASDSGLRRFVKQLEPEAIMTIHGEYSARFAKELTEEFGISAIAPSEAGEEILV